MKKRFIFFIILFFVGVSPIAVMGSVSGIGLYVTDEQELIEEGNRILEEIKELECRVAESETAEEIKEIKERMERLLKSTYKKYEKEIARIVEKGKNGCEELKQLFNDIEKAMRSFAKTVKDKLVSLSLS